MKKLVITLLFFICISILYANSGSVVLIQELPGFWFASLIIVFVELAAVLILKSRFNVLKTFLLVLSANITSTLCGVPLYIFYLKIWELTKIFDTFPKAVILLVFSFVIPTIFIEFFFYNKILADLNFGKRLLKVVVIHVLSYSFVITALIINRNYHII